MSWPQSLYDGRRIISGSLKGDVAVTTINAAAVSHMPKSVVMAAFVTFVSLVLAGCSTSGAPDLFGSSSSSNAVAEAPAAAPATTSTKKIAVAPVIGAPDAVAKQLQSQLGATLQQQKISVTQNPAEKASYTLRGYIVSAKEAKGTKVSYIWDVTDSGGKRVHRITGEELAPASGTSKDPWAAVTPPVVQRIATKTSQSLVTWLPTQKPAAPPPAVAGAGNTAGAAATKTAAAPAGSPVPGTSATTTGSIGGRAGSFQAVVPSVTGAPGDGSVSLTSAIQRELKKNGIPMSASAKVPAYRVEGRVKVGTANSKGKQPIQISWDVKDPQGKKLGTVSQNNEIPKGSLDGAWGRTADAAAAAAARGIIKLLPKSTATN